MKHRMGDILNIGLGNSTCILPNKWTNDKEVNKIVIPILQDALNLKAIEEYGGLDFKIDIKDNSISIDFGYEPTYQYDELLIYHIENNKGNCSIKRGIARGYYGSEIEILENTKYNDLVKKTGLEFKEFVNKWCEKLLV